MSIISRIKREYVISALRMAVVLPFAMIGRKQNKDVWLIGERYNQARDNGYCFFKYVTKEHPEQKIIYVIDENSNDYRKVAELGETVQYNSWMHYYLYCLSKVHISAHTDFCRPKDDRLSRYIKRALKYKDVFVPHGVSYAVSDFCMKKYANIDLFCCCGEFERRNLINNYGYSEKEAVLTGFPRLDYWYGEQVNKKQILLMPTWRRYLAQKSDTVIEETQYYKAFNGLINNSNLIKALEENNITLIFYLHNDMRKYANSFHSDTEKIVIISNDEKYDIQDLLKSSALLITDYSSVHFDFAYMSKPVIYYQFDREEFYDKQYAYSGFDIENSGFGEVFYDENKLIGAIIDKCCGNETMEDEYLKRMEFFYTKRDNKNCERVFESIKGIMK